MNNLFYNLKFYWQRSNATVASLLLFTIIFQTGCQIPYLVESAWTHLKIISSKKDIEKALENPDIPEEWKAKLKLTLEIRPYIKSLGLEITKNYRTFVDLKKPYISHLLIVAPEYSLKPKTWWFPIVGTFPYKGFHNEQKAIKASEYYSKKKYDTYIRGVTAYSTLGWFNDPLLSTMMKYPDEDLVETIIHESVHATIFIKNNVDFNEQLAVFIAKKATLYYCLNQSMQKYKNCLRAYADEDLFTDFLVQSYEKIDDFYKDKSNHNPEQKQKIFSTIKEFYKNEYSKKFSDKRYDYILDRDLNNAFFAAQKTYYSNQQKFEVVFEKQASKDIKQFIGMLKKLSSKEIKKLFE